MIETTWMTPQGWVRVLDALTIGAWHDNKHGSSHTRPPTDYDADHLLVRVIECIQGMVQVEIVCEPMLDYGATPASWSIVETGEEGVCRWTRPAPVRTRRRSAGDERRRPDGIAFRLFSDIRMGIEGNRAHGRHTLKEGERRFCALSWTEGAGRARTRSTEAQEHLERTAHFWRNWLAEGNYPDHPWRYYLQRSALDAEGAHLHADRGARRRARRPRCRRRRGANATGTTATAGCATRRSRSGGCTRSASTGRPTTSSSTSPTSSATSDGSLQIMYGIRGQKDLEESTLDHLKGYEGARPVRVGNGAYAQRQNDVYGAVLDSVYLHSKNRDHIPERLWPVLEDQVECAARVWREPDQGIWEARGEPRHYVSSKLMCWVALDRGARLAERRGQEELAERWQALADEIKRRHPRERGSTRAASSASTTRPTRSTPRRC